MKIVCAPDSFKESLSATDVAKAMARGVAHAAAELNIELQTDVCPVGDGGEGTMDALLGALGGEYREAEVLDPLGEPIRARYGIAQLEGEGIRVGIVELAEASGLARVPLARRNPTKTTTFGTGQLIRLAIEDDCDEIIVCIGGSATEDGGAGIAQALGAEFFDATDTLIEEPITGGMLKRISRVESPLNLPPIRVACDVANPLCGPNGAAFVYGPQKGATPQQVRELDEGLSHFASVIGDDPNARGAGAAGGAGFGLMTLCKATLVRGIDLVLDIIQFKQRCNGAALVLTGEGRLDRQSLQGKACMGVATVATTVGAPTIAIVGSTGVGADDCLASRGGWLGSYFGLSQRFGTERAWREAAGVIERAADAVTRDVLSHPNE